MEGPNIWTENVLVIEQHLISCEPVCLELNLIQEPSGRLDGAERKVVIQERLDCRCARDMSGLQVSASGGEKSSRTRRALRNHSCCAHQYGYRELFLHHRPASRGSLVSSQAEMSRRAKSSEGSVADSVNRLVICVLSRHLAPRPESILAMLREAKRRHFVTGRRLSAVRQCHQQVPALAVSFPPRWRTVKDSPDS